MLFSDDDRRTNQIRQTGARPFLAAFPTPRARAGESDRPRRGGPRPSPLSGRGELSPRQRPLPPPPPFPDAIRPSPFPRRCPLSESDRSSCPPATAHRAHGWQSDDIHERTTRARGQAQLPSCGRGRWCACLQSSTLPDCRLLMSA